MLLLSVNKTKGDNLDYVRESHYNSYESRSSRPTNPTMKTDPSGGAPIRWGSGGSNNKGVGYILFFITGKISGDLIPIDSYYFKPNRDNVNTIEAVQNGWVSISKSGRTMWFYKENGNYKKGWHYDNYYKGWYYFYDVTMGFSNTNLNATLMYNPRYEKSRWLIINNLWYEFKNGGKLVEYSGWRKYSGRLMYHIPGNFGTYRNTTVDISGTRYSFDSNGYLK